MFRIQTVMFSKYQNQLKLHHLQSKNPLGVVLESLGIYHMALASLGVALASPEIVVADLPQ